MIPPVCHIPPGSWDPGIRNSPIPNPGIEKTGPGLESLLATLSSKKRWNCSVLMASTGGTRPWPSSASMERRSWRDDDFCASICARQKCCRFCRRNTRYAEHCERHAAMDSGEPQDRAERSNLRTKCFHSRHSWSNQGSDGPWSSPNSDGSSWNKALTSL